MVVRRIYRKKKKNLQYYLSLTVPEPGHDFTFAVIVRKSHLFRVFIELLTFIIAGFLLSKETKKYSWFYMEKLLSHASFPYCKSSPVLVAFCFKLKTSIIKSSAKTILY